MFESIINFLEEATLLKSAQILRKELSITKNLTIPKDKEKKVMGNIYLNSGLIQNELRKKKSKEHAASKAPNRHRSRKRFVESEKKKW